MSASEEQLRLICGYIGQTYPQAGRRTRGRPHRSFMAVVKGNMQRVGNRGRVRWSQVIRCGKP